MKQNDGSQAKQALYEHMMLQPTQASQSIWNKPPFDFFYFVNYIMKFTFITYRKWRVCHNVEKNE
ncbi:MAG: hypothetical protein OXC62_10415 [Aestuariivita sp.]|nr:hypothetical protein [Aestuariivita sp.]